MIGKLSGRIDYIAADHVLIEAGGVGYMVHCAPGTLARLPQPGEAAALYTELIVREDLLQLIGFRTVAEREWHRLLTSVQGVGAKVALAILDALGPEGVSRALALGDAAAVKAAPGVGPKLANRIVNELADKAASVMALGAQAGRTAAPAAAVAPAVPLADTAPAPEEDDPLAAADALSALLNLGYERAQAARAVAEAGRDGSSGTADLIRAALRSLAPES
ncbi:Holliday junction branch migration protein RuvA [Paralimibaculum aggregatum]|uniref:Holliday junction branch migration complex subunit RuvA n=1 Tax=Paralimibaculum aggregatum TaxID=3036245 RepID=A0ABQ6LR36_9RHOB|nr:Holliday junction branch migration protein RuvA [Limibaculum sp. NKW23]GMG83350.1 Holliday junction branch migration protein RuvA [Limibaculum sp. NKW23]